MGDNDFNQYSTASQRLFANLVWRLRNEAAAMYSGLSSLLRSPPVACLRRPQQTRQSALHRFTCGFGLTVRRTSNQTFQMLKPVAGFFDLAVNLRDQIGEEINSYGFGVFDSQLEFVNLRSRDLFDFRFDLRQAMPGFGYAADKQDHFG